MMKNNERAMISTTEIAALASVDISTVSNWRRRFGGDFPQPALSVDSKRPMFDRSEVIEWLRRNPQVGGKRSGTQSELMRVLDLLRSEFAPDDYAEVIGQLLAAIVEDRKAGRNRHVRTSGEVQVLLDTTQFKSNDPTLLHVDSLVSVYQHLLAVSDPLAFYDEALEAGNNRLSESAEKTTPTPLIAFLTALAPPRAHGLVIDPVAGYGSLLLSSIREGKASLGLGVDLNVAAVRVANRRFLLANAEARSEVGDSLAGDALGSVRADLVIADPPLGLAFRPEHQATPWEFGTPKASNADTAWLQLAVARLLPGGRAIVVTTLGTLFQSDKATVQIRNEMVRRGAVQAIFTLPARLRNNTAVRLAVWVLTTPDSSDRRTNVLLVDLGTDNVESISPTGKGVAAFEQWIDDPNAPLDPTFAAAVPVTDLLAPGATLVPSRWTSAAEDNLDAGDWKLRVESSYITAKEAISRNLLLPAIEVDSHLTKPDSVTIGDLAKRGALTVVKGRHMERYDGSAESYPILSVKDLRQVRPDPGESRERAAAVPSTIAQLAYPGDVLVYTDGEKVVARVWQTPDWVIGRFMQVVRIVDEAWNPHYIAAAINSPSNIRHLIGGVARTHFNLSDFDIVELTSAQQRVAEVVEQQFQDVATKLAEASALVATAKAQILNALASGFVITHVDPVGLRPRVIEYEDLGGPV